MVEAARYTKGATVHTPAKWQMVRICTLTKHVQHTDNIDGDPEQEEHAKAQEAWDNGKGAGKVRMGLFACCPEDQRDCTATFHYFRVVRGTTFHHNADGNHE